MNVRSPFWGPPHVYASGFVPRHVIMPVSDNHSISLSALQGIVGNLSSGKSALVHRYLTGTYVQEESPEGKGNSMHV